MADLTGHIAREIGVPVIDGVAAAVKLVEALVGLGLGTSKTGDLAFPLAKPYSGTLSHLAPGTAGMRCSDECSQARRRRLSK